MTRSLTTPGFHGDRKCQPYFEKSLLVVFSWLDGDVQVYLSMLRSHANSEVWPVVATDGFPGIEARRLTSEVVNTFIRTRRRVLCLV